jgi:hypothetical protein
MRESKNVFFGRDKVRFLIASGHLGDPAIGNDGLVGLILSRSFAAICHLLFREARVHFSGRCVC